MHSDCDLLITRLFPLLSFRSFCLCLPSNNNPRNSLVWIEYPYFVRGKALSDDRRYDLLRDARERGKLKFQSRNEKASKRISNRGIFDNWKSFKEGKRNSTDESIQGRKRKSETK